MKQLVLDCSVSLAWIFEDETNSYTEKILLALSKVEVIVPTIWSLEMVNGLLVAERRKRISEAKLYQVIELIDALPITIDDLAAKHATGTILHLAYQYRLSSYDAAYLELAIRRGAELATQDIKLKEAGVHCGVGFFY